MNKCKIILGDISFSITLRQTLTASKIFTALPISEDAHKWGKEYYCYTNLNITLEEDAKDVINLGEIAFWPNGNAIAIGYGITPVSIGQEIRLADKCNIWADTEFDLNLLNNIKFPKTIKLAK